MPFVFVYLFINYKHCLLSCTPLFPLLILLDIVKPLFSALSLVNSTISCNRMKPPFLASLATDCIFLVPNMGDERLVPPSFLRLCFPFLFPNNLLKNNLFTLELFYVHRRVTRIMQRVLALQDLISLRQSDWVLLGLRHRCNLVVFL